MNESQELLSLKKLSFRQYSLEYIDDELVLVKIKSDITLDIPIKVFNIIRMLSLELEKPINLIICLNEAGKPTLEARKYAINLLKNNEFIGYISLYGAHPVAEVISKFVIRFIKQKRIAFFNKQSEALSWIYNQTHHIKKS